MRSYAMIAIGANIAALSALPSLEYRMTRSKRRLAASWGVMLEISVVAAPLPANGASGAPAAAVSPDPRAPNCCPATKATSTVRTATAIIHAGGVPRDVEVGLAVGFPQCWQNRAPAATSPPHDRHGWVTSDAPHEAQNCPVAGSPHRGHAALPEGLVMPEDTTARADSGDAATVCRGHGRGRYFPFTLTHWSTWPGEPVPCWPTCLAQHGRTSLTWRRRTTCVSSG